MKGWLCGPGGWLAPAGQGNGNGTVMAGDKVGFCTENDGFYTNIDGVVLQMLDYIRILA